MRSPASDVPTLALLHQVIIAPFARTAPVTGLGLGTEAGIGNFEFPSRSHRALAIRIRTGDGFIPLSRDGQSRRY